MRHILFSISLLICVAVQSTFVTYFFHAPIRDEDRSVAFDSLGEHLLKGSAFVDKETINWEGMHYDDRSVMYFGMFPALIRIPANYLSSNMRGRWGQPSTILALTITVFCLSQLLLRKLKKETDPVLFYSFLIPIVIAFGTPLMILACCAHIYHEAISWGLAWGSLSALIASNFLDKPSSTLKLAMLAATSGLALLARLTFGLPFIGFFAILALTSCCEKIFGEKGRRQRFGIPVIPLWKLSLASIPLLLATAVQAWYNWARFGSAYTFIDYTHYYLNPDNFGGELNLRRIPSLLNAYLIPHLGNFIASPPYIVMSTPTYETKGMFFDWKEPVLGLLITSPWLLFIAIIGALRLIRAGSSILQLSLIVCLTGQSLLILSYYWGSQRYTSEFLPLLTLLGSIGLPSLNWVKRIALTVLCCLGVCATIGSSLYWEMRDNSTVPYSLRLQLERLFSTRKPEVPQWTAKRIYLDSIDPSILEFTHVTLEKLKSVTAQPFSIDGYEFSRGVGLHAKMRLVYEIPVGSERFFTFGAISEDMRYNTDTSVQIFFRRADNGEELRRTSLLNHEHFYETIDFPLPADLKQLEIYVDDGGNGISMDHVNLVEAAFLLQND